LGNWARRDHPRFFTVRITGKERLDLVGTIKLVVYRAETAMAHLVREALPPGRREEERRLLQSLYASEADLIPDEAAGTLTVRVQHPANPLPGRAVPALCPELTATETVFPTTRLRLVYDYVETCNTLHEGALSFFSGFREAE
jgi:hypothetical protein